MPRKSEPFSLRLPRRIDEQVSDEARRTKRSKGAVVAALADEALRTRRFAGIAFRGADWNRRPWVIGTALDVWEIVAASRSFPSPDEMSQKTDLTEPQVRLALNYYGAFPEEIDEAIRDNERSLEELRTAFPTIDTISVE